MTNGRGDHARDTRHSLQEEDALHAYHFSQRKDNKFRSKLTFIHPRSSMMYPPLRSSSTVILLPSGIALCLYPEMTSKPTLEQSQETTLHKMYRAKLA